jgi:hypothetical protein
LFSFYAVGSGIRIRDPIKIIPDPGSLGSIKGRIPDPGSGSATLAIGYLYHMQFLYTEQSNIEAEAVQLFLAEATTGSSSLKQPQLLDDDSCLLSQAEAFLIHQRWILEKSSGEEEEVKEELEAGLHQVRINNKSLKNNLQIKCCCQPNVRCTGYSTSLQIRGVKYHGIFCVNQ